MRLLLVEKTAWTNCMCRGEQGGKKSIKDPKWEKCWVVPPGVFLPRNACHSAVSSPERKELIVLAVCSDASNPHQGLQTATTGEFSGSPGLTGHLSPSRVE